MNAMNYWWAVYELNINSPDRLTWYSPKTSKVQASTLQEVQNTINEDTTIALSLLEPIMKVKLDTENIADMTPEEAKLWDFLQPVKNGVRALLLGKADVYKKIQPWAEYFQELQNPDVVPTVVNVADDHSYAQAA